MKQIVEMAILNIQDTLHNGYVNNLNGHVDAADWMETTKIIVEIEKTIKNECKKYSNEEYHRFLDKIRCYINFLHSQNRGQFYAKAWHYLQGCRDLLDCTKDMEI